MTCWGRHPGTRDPVDAEHVAALDGAVEIAGEDGSLCARDGRGRVRCLLPPGATPLVLEGEGATAIGVLEGVVCGLLEGGTIRCAGLGEVQARAAADVHDAFDLASLEIHLCVLRREHPALCFDGGADSAQPIPGTEGAPRLGDVGGRPCPIDAAGSTPCTNDHFAPPASLAALDGAGARYCALTTGGEAHCLDGTGRAFVQLAGSVVAVASRATHQCVLTNEGGVRCRGEDGLGQVSGRVPPADDVATRVVGLGAMVDVAVGAARACAIDVAGALFCWSSAADAAAAVSSPPLRALVGNRTTLCGLDARGRVLCFDHDRFEPLRGITVSAIADGTGRLLLATRRDGVPAVLGAYAEDPTLQPLPALRGASDLRVTRIPEGICGVREGRVVCAALEGDPPAVPTLEGVTHVFGDGVEMVALTADGAWAWGRTRMVTRTESATPASQPLRAPDLDDTDALFVDGHVTRLTRAGTIERWSSGWLAVRGLEGLGAPRRVAASGTDGCALAASGEVWCWGPGARGDAHAREPSAWVDVARPE